MGTPEAKRHLAGQAFVGAAQRTHSQAAGVAPRGDRAGLGHEGGGDLQVEVSAQVCARSMEPPAEGSDTVRPSKLRPRSPLEPPEVGAAPGDPGEGGVDRSSGHPGPLHGPLDATPP